MLGLHLRGDRWLYGLAWSGDWLARLGRLDDLGIVLGVILVVRVERVISVAVAARAQAAALVLAKLFVRFGVRAGGPGHFVA